MRIIEWISSWASAIIVAVIIGTIIEMILPEGNAKKYIKVVIGIYVVFTIVTPVITKVTGEDIEVSSLLDLEQYIEEAEENSKVQNSIQESNQDSIKNIYLSSMKEDIRAKVEGKGYFITDITIEVAEDESYKINALWLWIEKKEGENTEEKSGIEEAEKGQIGVAIEPIQEVEKVEIKIGDTIEEDRQFIES